MVLRRSDACWYRSKSADSLSRKPRTASRKASLSSEVTPVIVTCSIGFPSTPHRGEILATVDGLPDGSNGLSAWRSSFDSSPRSLAHTPSARSIVGRMNLSPKTAYTATNESAKLDLCTVNAAVIRSSAVNGLFLWQAPCPESPIRRSSHRARTWCKHGTASLEANS